MQKYLIDVVLLLAVVGIGFYLKRFLPTKKNSSWQGEVVEKKEENQIFFVTVVDGNNKKQTVTISKILWNNLQRGDKIEKRAGDPYPRKI